MPKETFCQSPINTFIYTWNSIQFQFSLEKVAEILIDPWTALGPFSISCFRILTIKLARLIDP